MTPEQRIAGLRAALAKAAPRPWIHHLHSGVIRAGETTLFDGLGTTGDRNAVVSAINNAEALLGCAEALVEAVEVLDVELTDPAGIARLAMYRAALAKLGGE